MSIQSILTSLAPYHFLVWGAQMGMELYQSQVMTKLCYWYLPMPQFTQLQKRVFPVYFALDTGLSVLLLLTYPPHSVATFTQATSGLPVWSTIVPLTLKLVTSVLNYFVYGPQTSDAMMERVRQATADAKKGGEMSEEMRRLKKRFSRAHAMAIHLNAINMLATAWYGIFGLAGRVQLAEL